MSAQQPTTTDRQLTLGEEIAQAAALQQNRQPVNHPAPSDIEAREDRSLPDHLQGVAHPHQTAVCERCGNYIWVTDDGTELGHCRAGDNADESCPHRPECVEPTDPHTGGEQ